MNIILNNPYRIAGVLVGTTAREQERQIKRLKQFIEADQTPEEDFSFPILGTLRRSISDMERAESMLNLDSDKIAASLFWLYKGNDVTDDPAFEALKEGSIGTAYRIWNKLISDEDEYGERFYKPITPKNFSAFHNCSILNLIRPNGRIKDAIQEQLTFLDSDFVSDFVIAAADSTYKISKSELQISFLNQLFYQIDASDKLRLARIIEIINKLQFSGKKEFLSSFAQKNIEQIDKAIEECKTKRKAHKAEAFQSGQTLFKQITESIIQLRTMLRASDIKFSSISDKAAAELLQCGIDYFTAYKDSNTDPSEHSMQLFRRAESLAVGNIIRERVQDNKAALQAWINEQPIRIKPEKIEDNIFVVTSNSEKYRNVSNSKNQMEEWVLFVPDAEDRIFQADKFIEKYKPKLMKMRNELGDSDEFYLNISNALALRAMEILMTEVKEKQDSGQNTELHQTIKDAIRISRKVSTLDMHASQKAIYNKNISELKSIAEKLGVNISNCNSDNMQSRDISDEEDDRFFMLVLVSIIIAIVVIVTIVLSDALK